MLELDYPLRRASSEVAVLMSFLYFLYDGLHFAQLLFRSLRPQCPQAEYLIINCLVLTVELPPKIAVR